MSYCSFSGGEEYKNHFHPGIYVCSECGHELFSSLSKFEHSSPWPAFSETIHKDSVSKYPEAWGPIKVCCGKCGNGLGHEFLNDGPREGLSRFWIFSSSLTFIPKEKVDGQKGELWKRETFSAAEGVDSEWSVLGQSLMDLQGSDGKCPHLTARKEDWSTFLNS